MAPHITPESLIRRSDSKDPATTCRGTNKNGKPCRRSLNSPKPSPNAPRNSASRGVVAVLEDDIGNTGSAAFYCWQHQDQAGNLSPKPTTGRPLNSRIVPIEERTSIDSLVARLGVASIQESTPTRKPRDYKKQYAPRPTGPQKPHTQQHPHYDEQKPTQPPRRKPEKGFWASLCCMSSTDDDDYLEVVRHKQRMQAPRPPPETTQVGNTSLQYPIPSRPRPHPQPTGRPAPNGPHRHTASSTGVPLRRPLLDVPAHSLNSRRAASAPGSTSNLLSFIPPHLPPQTTSALLSELSKPISPHDEDGYIYIFWLTEKDSTPSEHAAASLLAPPTSRTRRISDVMSEYSYTPDDKPQARRTIKLKIGRANNVQRRMNEWTRQCGYNLSLVRFYPYVPSPQSSPASSPARPSASDVQLSRPPPERTASDQVRKVPHAHRVERLVHLELADQRVMRKCAACGREHREWFEIEATQAGVKAVDEVVKRWVRWAEASPSDKK